MATWLLVVLRLNCTHLRPTGHQSFSGALNLVGQSLVVAGIALVVVGIALVVAGIALAVAAFVVAALVVVALSVAALAAAGIALASIALAAVLVVVALAADVAAAHVTISFVPPSGPSPTTESAQALPVAALAVAALAAAALAVATLSVTALVLLAAALAVVGLAVAAVVAAPVPVIPLGEAVALRQFPLRLSTACLQPTNSLLSLAFHCFEPSHVPTPSVPSSGPSPTTESAQAHSPPHRQQRCLTCFAMPGSGAPNKSPSPSCAVTPNSQLSPGALARVCNLLEVFRPWGSHHRHCCFQEEIAESHVRIHAVSGVITCKGATPVGIFAGYIYFPSVCYTGCLACLLCW